MRVPTLILMGLLSVAAVGRGAPAERVLSAEQRVRRVLPDRDGAIWVLFSRSSIIHKYSRQGHILRGFDTSSLEEVLLSPGERKTLHDIALDSDGRLLALLGVSHRPTKRFASFILRFADLERQPEVISLENGVAGYKLGVDASGNFVILGLKSTDLVKTELQHISGRYPVVHRYTAGGGYAGSFLPVDIDAGSEDSLTRELASPLHHPGNFAVAQNGDVWVLWMEFPDEWTRPQGKLPSRLYRIDSRGESVPVSPTPPFDGFFITGVIPYGRTPHVALEWKGRGSAGLETVLSDTGGTILAQGDYPGWVVGLTDDRVLLSLSEPGEGRFSLVWEPRR